MKFLDPWASFQYMGGALSIHVSLALYGYFEYTQKKYTSDDQFNYYDNKCLN